MQQHKGMTLIGMLLTMFLVAAGALLALRIIPVYIQYFTIIQSIKSLDSLPATAFTGDPILDAEALRSSLFKRFDINGIEIPKEDQLHIMPKGPHKFDVQIKYQVIKPLVYNVSLMFDFNETREVVTAGEN